MSAVRTVAMVVGRPVIVMMTGGRGVRVSRQRAHVTEDRRQRDERETCGDERGPMTHRTQGTFDGPGLSTPPTRQDPQLVRATYLAMEVTGWFVIVPLSLASLPTGLVMSLGTEWGLFRHYWIVVKLVITILATILLLVHMQPVGHLARVVAETTLARGELAGLRVQLVADAAAAVLALLIATALSVYKPRGMTAYGRREQRAQREAGMELGGRPMITTPRWVKVLGIVAVILVLLVIALHMADRGLGGH